MKFGENLRNRLNSMKTLAFIAPVTLLSGPAAGQEAEAPLETGEAAQAASSIYQPLGPDMIKGQPVDPNVDFWGSMGLQTQYSPTGEYARWMHDGPLLWIAFGVSIFVLALLIYVLVRFNRRSNPSASKTSHNLVLEILWTALPVVILVLVAVPSLKLLARQYESPPENAVTVKTIGYQWYWGYEYPDHGFGEIVSNMMPEDEAEAVGFPRQLATDNRMVVPVGVPIRIQTTAADVIHSFAVPSLWFKLDAVPGRINEKMLLIEEEGIYFGQCSELCGARHGYMPIMVEAVSPEKFAAWVALQGGTMPGAKPAVAEPVATQAPADEAAAPAEADAV